MGMNAGAVTINVAKPEHAPAHVIARTVPPYIF